MRFVGGDIVDGPEGESYRVLDDSGSLAAVYRLDGGQARPEVVLST
jgi:hypothetical protein